jgi:arginase
VRDRFILTPYMLDRALPSLLLIAQPEWEVNSVELPPAELQIRVSALHRCLASRVAETLRSGERPVSLAGDCCSAMGVVAGMQQAGIDPALIWFDAHGDFNTWETTPSGFVGGMPLAMLVGRGDQTMPAALGLRSLDEDLIILTDARDLDPGERLALQGSRIRHLPSVSDLINFPLPDRPLLVHIDPDVIDPTVAPAMSYPAAGGPAAEEMTQVLRYLAGTGKVVAVSMATWDPHLDATGQTAKVCMDLLRSFLEE